MRPWLTVVGMGDDGPDGLSPAAQRALADAVEIHGAERHLAMLSADIGAQRKPWPRPFDVGAVLQRRGEPTCVIASGDPMFHGVGATLSRHVPVAEMHIIPAPSSMSLAAARMGWAMQDIEVVSLLGGNLALLTAACRDGRRLVLLSADGETPARVAAHVRDIGFGPSPMTVFESLGGTTERALRHRAEAWPSEYAVAALNLIALECIAESAATPWPSSAGLPDEAFEHVGPLTKRDVRAVTLARLAPHPGQLLWDVGAGSGSVGIEWMRTHPQCRAIAIEAHAERQGTIERNRRTLGVPGLQLVRGSAPAALAGLPVPDAVFIGGGVTGEGVLDACWEALRSGGRLVVNAVTLQAEQRVMQWRHAHGGSLTRLSIAHVQDLGAFDTWRPVLPITLYDVRKP